MRLLLYPSWKNHLISNDSISHLCFGPGVEPIACVMKESQMKEFQTAGLTELCVQFWDESRSSTAMVIHTACYLIYNRGDDI